MPLLVLLCGAAGTGKSTVARAWCSRRALAAAIDLDTVRELVCGGALDPQEIGSGQRRQYEASVRATVALALAFLESGHDVVVTDVVDPGSLDGLWRPLLSKVPHQVVRLQADLATTIARAGGRGKRVHEEWVRVQHAYEVPEGVLVIESTDLDVTTTVDTLEALLH